MYKIPFFIAFLVLPGNLRGYSKEQQSQATPQLNAAFRAEPKLLSKEQVAKIMKKAGFPKEVVPVITCIAEHESRFIPNAVNYNTNKTRDYGLLQINDVWLQSCNTTATNLTQPFENAKCAYKVYKMQGLTAWATYKSFKNECLAYRVNDFSYVDLVADGQINNIQTNNLM